MKLMFFGPPGSGKGSYSSRIANELDLVAIAPGDMYREHIKKGTELGKLAAEYVHKAVNVPDEVTNKMVKERLSQPDTKRGFIFVGYPRSIPQAKGLDKMTKIDAVVNLIAPKEILTEITSSRRICSNPKCDGNYNIADIHKTIDGVEYILPPLLPKEENICDKCGSPLTQRKDDAKELVEIRLKVHEKQSKPVLKHYEGKVPFINIYMNRPPKEVVKRILEEIKKLNLT